MVVPANFVEQPNVNMRYQVIKYGVVYEKKHMKNGTGLSARSLECTATIRQNN